MKGFTLSNTIYLILIVSVLGLVTGAVFQACGTAGKYNTKNYPDSLVLKAFEATDINVEKFSVRVLKVVRADIAMGKFTRDEALDFLDIWKARVTVGVPYADIGALIAKYTAEFFMPKGDVISEAAMIAYYMLSPDVDLLNTPTPIGPQDKEVLGRFLQFIIDGI